nr:immunoglobulin heavy chain junction region [Macaca mulatta]MOW93354.1 immunoglobulin heavy chain junction region [Macaca mulatta]MOW93404.1 immunoglobulin heavy chain junction region [Macaca mulatta]MOW93445.1 immunoglobulin heavy chain junction region [Macaca mulatta]MOW93465.1 immunoglobulin heavy chain junction region [Macaca mulatta]
CATYSLDYW